LRKLRRKGRGFGEVDDRAGDVVEVAGEDIQADEDHFGRNDDQRMDMIFLDRLCEDIEVAHVLAKLLAHLDVADFQIHDLVVHDAAFGVHGSPS
jgi:hypothetical protein